MKTAQSALIKTSLLAVLACTSSLLLAQPPEGQGGPRKPPQEALDACKSSSAGQECGFTSPHGAVKGTCWAPEGKALACKPADAPGGESRPKKQ